MTARWALAARTAVVVAALWPAVALGLAAAVPSGDAAAGATIRPARSLVYRFGAVGSKGKIASTERRVPTPVAGIEGTVVQVATSNSDGYARTSGGAVWAWGAGAVGELGDGATPRTSLRATKVAFPRGVRITLLANPMPFDAALAVDATGHVWGWGLDASGDLCGTSAVERRPVRLPLSRVTLAAGAKTHSLFVAGGRVEACGDGTAGALGTGTTASVSAPTPVVDLPAGADVVALTASWEGAGALLRDGTYFDWGYDAAGQLGDGTTTDSNVPVRVHLPAAVRQVFQGGSGPGNGQTVALLSNATTWAWGDGTRGQLGTGTRASSDVPVAVDVPAGVTFVRVASGGYASYGIDRSGRLWAWGGNQNGQLGTGSRRRVETRPVEVGFRARRVTSTANNVAVLAGR